MATYYPVIITAAIFIALNIQDVLRNNPDRVPINTLQALVCVGLMIILSLKDVEFVSWGLIALSTVIFIICYFLGTNAQSMNIQSINNSHNSTPTIMSCPSPASGSPSIISLPSSPTMSAQVSQYNFTPITSCR